MNTSLQHARHNKEVYDHLITYESFTDWMVIAAFYCALHYANAVIFPFTESGITYFDLDTYFSKKGGGTKHSVTLELIRKKHFPISFRYDFLKIAAHSARYVNFKIHPKVAKQARRNVRKIERYCEEVFAKRSSG